MILGIDVLYSSTSTYDNLLTSCRVITNMIIRGQNSTATCRYDDVY